MPEANRAALAKKSWSGVTLPHTTAEAEISKIAGTPGSSSERVSKGESPSPIPKQATSAIHPGAPVPKAKPVATKATAKPKIPGPLRFAANETNPARTTPMINCQFESDPTAIKTQWFGYNY